MKYDNGYLQILYHTYQCIAAQNEYIHKNDKIGTWLHKIGIHVIA